MLLILFVDGYLLVNKLLYKIFKVGFRLVRIEGLLFHGKSKRVLGFGILVKLGGLIGRTGLTMRIRDDFTIEGYINLS